MHIRLHYGPQAGEVQFVRNDVARQLVALGRASDPNLLPVDSEVPAAAAVVPEVKIVANRRSRTSE